MAQIGSAITRNFQEKLEQRLDTPWVASARLFNQQDRYKIKLHAAGFRLIYETRDSALVVVVVVIGKHERNMCITLRQDDGRDAHG